MLGSKKGIVATIPTGVNRLQRLWYDLLGYMTWHLVENHVCAIKQFRGVAARYNRRCDGYWAMVHLASWIVETRLTRRAGL